MDTGVNNGSTSCDDCKNMLVWYSLNRQGEKGLTSGVENNFISQ